VLFEAAEAIAAAGEGALGAGPRAHALLRRLDAWAERSRGRPGGEGEALLWSSLVHVGWCPVLVEPPEPGLPWPHHRPGAARDSAAGAGAEGDAGGADAAAVDAEPPLALAPPRMVRPAAEAWLASAPARLCAGRAGGALRALLGWEAPLSPQAALAQLVELARLYPAAASWPDDAPAPRDRVAAAAAGLYTVLASALADPLQAEAIEMSLKSAALVWVGTGFADADAAALAPRDAAVPGLLFAVPPDIAGPAREVLRLAGVRDRRAGGFWVEGKGLGHQHAAGACSLG
jgi:sacsin